MVLTSPGWKADMAFPHTDFPKKEIKHMWAILAHFILLISHSYISQVI